MIIIRKLEIKILLKPTIAELMHLNIHFFFPFAISEWNKLDSELDNAKSYSYLENPC